MAATPVRDIASFKVSKAPDTVYYIPEFISHEEEKYLIDHVRICVNFDVFGMLSSYLNAAHPSSHLETCLFCTKTKMDSTLKQETAKLGQVNDITLQYCKKQFAESVMIPGCGTPRGLPHPKGMIAEKLPQWLEIYANKIAKLGVFEERVPNHVLVNEYKPQQGIMPHEDGPLFYPVVTTINLGSHSVLQFYQHSSKQDGDSQSENHSEPIFTLLLKPRSLLILKDSVYTSYLHGIAECVEDTVDDNVANLSSTENKVGEVLTRGVRISLTIRFVPKTLKMKFMFGSR
ncbi:Alpha-ketoglutarate-dependent dioxygenase alkB-like 6 [Holothuria leucospilota]|uniref:Alpha-ketoglutarate-dependent dioxygenase alkB-like 6 n=1 Tax=Holothuria leucospilota TaxID=206669 RepID=A0A9Q1CH90_HOLLE|nr:Alpha-ketoglutarate-dependent dioxygenase alkB-like 6 [Holothuria leucospilota]